MYLTQDAPESSQATLRAYALPEVPPSVHEVAESPEHARFVATRDFLAQ